MKRQKVTSAHIIHYGHKTKEKSGAFCRFCKQLDIFNQKVYNARCKEALKMVIAMFNAWYFFWLILAAGATVGLYFLLRKRSVFAQKTVLFSFLALGLLLHFLKVYIPPYSVDESRMLRDSWFINICAANIALFPLCFSLRGMR